MPGTKMTGLAATGIGVLFIYAGVRGFSILKAAQNVIRGTAPTTGQSVTPLTAPGGSVPVSTAPGGAGSPHGGSWSQGAVRQLWIMNGGPSSTAQNASCHAMQESGGDASVTSPNPDGGINVGLFQLDTKGVGAGHTVAQLQDPNLNTQITIRATGGGRNWSQWATPGC